MKALKLILLVVLLLSAIATTSSWGQSTLDCSEAGENLVGLIWSDGTFTLNPHNYETQTGTLYIFNPSGGDVQGWELSLNFDYFNLVLLSASLYGNGDNASSIPNEFVVGLGSPLLPDAYGAVAVASFTFLLQGVEDEFSFYAAPIGTPSLPGSMALVTGSSTNVVPLLPVGGAGNPIGNLYQNLGTELDYCPEIAPPNAPPSAVIDQAFTDANIPVTFDILANDSDPDGTLDYSSVEFVTSPSGGGDFQYNGDGTVTYTPLPDFYGIDGLRYRVADNDGAWSNDAIIAVFVNDPPVANNDSASTVRNSSVTIDLLANDSDSDGTLDPATLVLGPVSLGTSLVDNGDGTVTYQPTLFTYEEQFTYTVQDNDGATSNTATVTVTVSQPYGPIVVPDCTGVGENFLGIVWENNQFSMPDAPTTGETIYGRVYIFNPSGGTVDGFAFVLDYDVVYGSSSVGFNPILPYSVTFIEGMDPGTWSYMLDEPLVPDASGAVPVMEIQMELGLNSGVDIYSNPATTITPVTEQLFTGGDPSPVQLNLLGDDITPIGSLNGTDLYYCQAENQPPVAVPDNVTTLEDQSVVIDLAGNDYDVDSPLDLTSINLSNPINSGTLIDNGDGTVTYTPYPNYFGMDLFSYTIADDSGATSAWVTATVTITEVLDPFELMAPDCPDSNTMAFVWSSGEFDIDPGPTLVGYLMLFKPTRSCLEFFEFGLEFDGISSPLTENVTLFGDANNFIATQYPGSYWFSTSIGADLHPNSQGVVVLAEITFEDVVDPAEIFFATPMDAFDFHYQSCDGTPVEMVPVSGDFGVPTATIGSLNPPSYCGTSNPPVISDLGEITVFLNTPQYNLDLGEYVTDEDPPGELTWGVSGNDDLYVVFNGAVATIRPKLNAWFGTNTLTFTATDSGGLSGNADFTITWHHAFDQFVEIVTDAGESFYAGTRYPGTSEFDHQVDQLISSVEPSLFLAELPGMTDYAYVRHMLTGSESDVGVATLDGQRYDQYFGEYRAVPLGEFCFYECIWNDATEEYDCGDDCQFELEAGRFYSLIWTPAGQWADISLVEETDQVWLRTDTHPIYDATNTIDQWEFKVETTNNGANPVTRTLQFNPSFVSTDGIELKLWDETEGQLIDLWATSVHSFEVPGNSYEARSFILFVGTPGVSGDTDGDGVPDVDDACPGEDASFFDRDGDGCIDPVIGGRHLEYWGEGTFPLEYVVDHLGVDEITDDSDLPAIQQGFAAWDGLAGTEIAIEYGGETTDLVADSFDGINTVTFHDGDYDFIRGTVAVGLSTSFTETATFQGQTIRPGQIVDTDVIFNDEEFNFCTPTNPIDGALDLQSIITHEAGHMLGLSHSAVKTSTMFYVLQPDTTGTSLEREDRLAMFKAYYTDPAYTGTTHLQGTVTSGWTGQPVAGAIVFVVDVVAGDTLGCDFTLPDDGTFHFIGLPVGETLELSIHPLDGSEAIGYLQPISVNRTIDGAERELFDPEFWNSGDSASEESLEVTQIVLGPGETFTADFVTNVDTTGPSIIAVSPASGATEVPLDAAVLFRCDEAIDPASLAGNFNLSEVGVGTLIPGNAALVEDDRTLSYTLTDFIKFETQYELRVGGGITDRYGNEMGSEFVMTFTTQQRPPLSMDSLSPRKGVAGSVVVIIGEGFSPEAEQNAVYYDSEGHALRTWDVLQNSPNQLVVQVPDDLEVGVGDVYVVSGNTTSNRLLYTVLPPGEEARGLETAAVDLFALPRKVEAHPAGDMVYVATDYGLSYVDVSDPSAPVHSSAALGLGLKDLDLSPGGNRVYGIGAADNRLHVWDTQDHVTLFEETLDFRLRGILVDPSGRRAYLATEYSGIQILDINEGYVNFLRPIGALQADGIRPLGAMACDPAGNYLLAAAGGGKLLVFDLNTFELHTTVEVMPSPRDVVVDPYGERAYVTDESGYVSIVSLGSFARVMDITCGGEMLGSAIDPMGSFVYAVNHQLDNLDVIDLRIDSASYRSISTRLPQQTNPVDVALSPGGLYAYVICETDQRLAVNTVGAGPMLASLSRRSGPAGAKVVLSGVDFEGGRVSFAGAPVDIEGQPTDTAVTVSVPADAGSGTVMVLGAEPGELSNGIEFQVLEATPPGALRLSAAVQPAGQPALTGAVAANSNDRMVAVGGQDGRVHLLNTDPNTSQFNSFVGETAPLGGPVSDLVCSPDGLTVYAVSPEDPVVRQFNINPGSASFAGQLSAVTLDGGAPVSAALSPDGRTLLTADGTSPLVHVIDWANGNVQTVAVGSQPGRLAFHPAGQHAYVVTTGGVVAMDMAGPVLAPVSVDGLPVDLVFSPDGSRCYVLVEPSSSGDRTLVILNTETPGQPSVLNSLVFPAESGLLDERLVLSPAGDRLLLHLREVGLVLVDVANGYRITQPDIVAAGAEVGLAFATSGSLVYAAAAEDATVRAFDFSDAMQLAKVWGDDQTAVVNTVLESSLRVRVTDQATGEGLAGVPVTFNIDTQAKLASGAPVTLGQTATVDKLQILKATNHVKPPLDVLKGGKMGGDTWEDAVVVPGLPYTDTGNTWNATDDYDEACPYGGSTAPDVVYAFTSDFDGAIAVDLCGSSYDTKVFVYANAVTPGEPWACNDDFYLGDPNCLDWVSLVPEMVVYEGDTYYIVVDGFNGGGGDYVLNLTKKYEMNPAGYLVTDDPDSQPTTLTMGTDQYGFADVRWNLGLRPGTQFLEAGVLGADDSPQTFTARALLNQDHLDFELVESRLAPQPDATDVAVTTAVQVSFTRPLDTALFTEDKFFLSADGGATAAPSVLGLTDDNTTATLIPRGVLEYGTVYTVVLGPQIYATNGEQLTPYFFTFTTEPAPPGPELLGVNPPAAIPLTTVMLTGSGFSPDPALNTVTFGQLTAPVSLAEPDYIITKVPLGSLPGLTTVTVTVGGQVTEAMPFNVLAPTLDGPDEVVVRVPTGSGTKAATVSPDGAVLYAVAPEADVVIPVDLVNFTTLPSIPVGDMPWAITRHPDGDLVYVANRMSGDLTSIGIDPDLTGYHRGVGNVGVGAQPVDLVITPAGDRVLVANEESQELTVVDADSKSATYNSVVKRVPVSQGAKAVTVSPDGARIYLGTDEGYILIGAVDYGVVRRVPVSQGAKAVTVSPDGALLVYLDQAGDIWIFDVGVGSDREDQIVARVPMSSGAKAATVSPDGARLYVVPDESDLIYVYALDIGTSVGVVGQPGGAPPMELELVQTLTAGENPQMVVFDPTGSGRFMVPNAGDNTISVFDQAFGSITGFLQAECDGAVSPLAGVEVDIFRNLDGLLAASVMTDENGHYSQSLPQGSYNVTLVTPLGYTLPTEEVGQEVVAGQSHTVDWQVYCEPVIPDQRKMSFWKHQLALALLGLNNYEISGDELCSYLDLIEGHFNNNAINEVRVYDPPESDLCMDKLQVAKDLLNLDGDEDMLAKAKQELLALLFNVASDKLSLRAIISEDGANVSRAITFVDGCIDDGDPANDEQAMKIAKNINKGKMVDAGLIPETIPDIFYSPVATHFHLDQNYPNPFNPECRIRFGVPKPGLVRLKIFDVSGRLVRTLVDENLRTGTYIKVWNGTDSRGLPVASGVYFYKMEAGSFVRTRKMLLMK